MRLANPAVQTEAGDTRIETVSATGGEIRLRFSPAIAQNQSYSGLISPLEFTGLKNAPTEVSLS